MIVSRETTERLGIYQSLIKSWNPKINLVAPSTVADIGRRHIEDCLQVASLQGPEHGSWADLGSGGGLPGIVVAIAHAEHPISFILVESDQRKAAFLRTAIRETGLNRVKVLNKRIEAVPALNADCISTRALAPLPRLMSYLELHLAAPGKAFLMKGRQWTSEVEEARKTWNFDYVAHPSRTEPGAAILEVSGVRHGA